MTTWLDVLKFNDDGLIPAIAQDKAKYPKNYNQNYL